MKTQITTENLAVTIRNLLVKHTETVDNNTRDLQTLDVISRKLIIDLNSQSVGSDAIFNHLDLAVKTFDFEAARTIYVIIAEFLVWLGLNYFKDNKLKISLFSYPKVIGKLVALVWDIIGIFKKDLDAVLPAKP